MANGQASSIFNDRRGQNPFQPVVPTNLKSRAPQRQQQQPQAVRQFGGDSYLGQGKSIPNGSLPPTMFNGKTYTRDNPNLLALRQQQVAIGERAQY